MELGVKLLRLSLGASLFSQFPIACITIQANREMLQYFVWVTIANRRQQTGATTKTARPKKNCNSMQEEQIPAATCRYLSQCHLLLY